MQEPEIDKHFILNIIFILIIAFSIACMHVENNRQISLLTAKPDVLVG